MTVRGRRYERDAVLPKRAKSLPATQTCSADRPVPLGGAGSPQTSTVPMRTLALVDSVAFPTGVVVHTYHPAP